MHQKPMCLRKIYLCILAVFMWIGCKRIQPQPDNPDLPAATTPVDQIVFITLDVRLDSTCGDYRVEILQKGVASGKMKETMDHLALSDVSGHWKISLLNSKGMEENFLLTGNPLHRHFESVDEDGQLFTQEVHLSAIQFPFRMRYHTGMVTLKIAKYQPEIGYKTIFQSPIHP